MTEPTLDQSHVFERIARELVTIRKQMTDVVNAMREAESEVPEKMRRFVMYESHGIPVPTHLHREMERCDDRYRQLLEGLHLDGGAFEKVRREMAKDPANRWDHTRALSAPKPKEPPG